MGAIYTEAQKEATRRYVNSTDQIRVRTEKGNLDFIKAHAEAMGETMGEFINLSTTEMEEIDQNESIRLLQNGQFLVFLKGWNKKEKNTATETNATANTEEN